MSSWRSGASTESERLDVQSDGATRLSLKRQQLLCQLPNTNTPSFSDTSQTHTHISLTPQRLHPPLHPLSWFHRGSDLCLLGLAGCHWSIPAVWTEEDTPSPATYIRTAPVSCQVGMCGETTAECSLAHLLLLALSKAISSILKKGNSNP